MVFFRFEVLIFLTSSKPVNLKRDVHLLCTADFTRWFWPVKTQVPFISSVFEVSQSASSAFVWFSTFAFHIYVPPRLRKFLIGLQFDLSFAFYSKGKRRKEKAKVWCLFCFYLKSSGQFARFPFESCWKHLVLLKEPLESVL